ncbi:MAG TPA: biopolymer transporter ExbD [Longimicrobiales bacterium]|jgi:biopolymer transport protein ExbD
MMRRVARRRDDLPLTADINVTSLVDVAFTLLVIFIITAPALQGGIEVEVPEADVQPLTHVDQPFIVTLDAEGTVFLEESPLTLADFRASFGQLMAAGGIERVYVQADRAATWDMVFKVVGVITDAGLDIAMVGEPWPEG